MINMASIFDKWNAQIDVEGLKADIAEADNGNSGDYKEVPVGTYEVSIDKMELKESSKGDPMVSIWFKILTGDFHNCRLFWNQVITRGFQISQIKSFLKSLQAVDDEKIEFQNYAQFNDLILDVYEAVNGHLEYLLKYEQNKKGFSKFTVEEVYEV